MTKHTLIGTLALLLASCADAPESFDKAAAQDAKADDSPSICITLDLPRGCDVCAAVGWYGDGECDTFCTFPDPDCDECGEIDRTCSDLGACHAGWTWDAPNCECACPVADDTCGDVDRSCADLGACPAGWTWDAPNCECACPA